MPKLKPIRLNCQLTDCAYFLEIRGEVYCTNTQKRYYLGARPCPLYHINWQKKIDEATQILEQDKQRGLDQ